MIIKHPIIGQHVKYVSHQPPDAGPPVLCEGVVELAREVAGDVVLNVRDTRSGAGVERPMTAVILIDRAGYDHALQDWARER